MTLLVQLACPLDRMNQLGFDAESHGLRRGARATTASREDTAAKDDERYARDSTEGDNKT